MHLFHYPACGNDIRWNTVVSSLVRPRKAWTMSTSVIECVYLNAQSLQMDRRKQKEDITLLGKIVPLASIQSIQSSHYQVIEVLI